MFFFQAFLFGPHNNHKISMSFHGPFFNRKPPLFPILDPRTLRHKTDGNMCYHPFACIFDAQFFSTPPQGESRKGIRMDYGNYHDP